MKQEINNDINKIHIGSIIIIIIAIMIIITVGTLAWLTYRSKNTAMVLTVGEMDGMSITLKPYQITAALTPTNDYTTQQYVDITVTNKKTTADSFKLYYKIESIDAALIDSGFKYTIDKSTNNWSSKTTVKTSDFSHAVAGQNMEIYSEEVPGNNTTYKYRVYLWIDNTAANQANMQGKIFKGELRADIISLSNGQTKVAYLEVNPYSSYYKTVSNSTIILLFIKKELIVVTLLMPQHNKTDTFKASVF